LYSYAVQSFKNQAAFIPVGHAHMHSAWSAGPKIALATFCTSVGCVCVHTYHVCNNYVMYIVAM